MDLPAVICRYADRFAALGRGDHHVGSPLGAWLILALAAPAATGQEADQIAETLGTDVETAHHIAMELLARPHPAVSAAAAAWAHEGLTGLDPWLGSLPVGVQAGPLPTQDQADAWARKRTGGLIDQLPLNTRNALVLLASVVATRITWVTTPFETADAAELGGPWSTVLTRVLRAPGGGFHDAFITDTERAGLVAVHSTQADGIYVTSVIADPAVAPADVLAAAHQIAIARAQYLWNDTSVSLFDLPLGEHPLWIITEEHAAEEGEQVDALLPAWHATSTHGLLTEPALGLAALGSALQQLAGTTGPIQVTQAAATQYSRRGFEAALVTGYGVGGVEWIVEPGPHRTATLRFAHPYAVVAVAQGHEPGNPWNGLPVFAAWITDPDDAQD